MIRRWLVSAGISFLAAISMTTQANAFSSKHCGIDDPSPRDTPHRQILEYTGDLATRRRPAEDKACDHYARGLLYHLGGQLDLAIADYSKAIGYMSGFSEAYAARGDAYQATGRLEEARADYQQARRLGQGNADALNGSCWERAIRGSPLDLALSDCNRAIELDGTEAYIWDSRCLVNFRLEHYAAAISDCDQAIKLGGHLPYPLALGYSFYVRGLSKTKNGDQAGGSGDIAEAIKYDRTIAGQYAMYGIAPLIDDESAQPGSR